MKHQTSKALLALLATVALAIACAGPAAGQSPHSPPPDDPVQIPLDPAIREMMNKPRPVPVDAVAVVTSLLDKKPARLHELEAIVGALHRDPAKAEDATGPITRFRVAPGLSRARVELLFDAGEEAKAVDDPRLASWQVDLASGAAAVKALLERRLGKPREVVHDGETLLRFQDYYFASAANDTEQFFTLYWYATPPAWAAAPRDGDGARP